MIKDRFGCNIELEEWFAHNVGEFYSHWILAKVVNLYGDLYIQWSDSKEMTLFEKYWNENQKFDTMKLIFSYIIL